MDLLELYKAAGWQGGTIHQIRTAIHKVACNDIVCFFTINKTPCWVHKTAKEAAYAIKDKILYFNEDCCSWLIEELWK